MYQNRWWRFSPGLRSVQRQKFRIRFPSLISQWGNLHNYNNDMQIHANKRKILLQRNKGVFTSQIDTSLISERNLYLQQLEETYSNKRLILWKRMIKYYTMNYYIYMYVFTYIYMYMCICIQCAKHWHLNIYCTSVKPRWLIKMQQDSPQRI